MTKLMAPDVNVPPPKNADDATPAPKESDDFCVLQVSVSDNPRRMAGLEYGQLSGDRATAGGRHRLSIRRRGPGLHTSSPR